MINLNFEETINLLKELRKKYISDFDISDYYFEIMKAIYNYQEQNNNFKFTDKMPSIVTGLDLFGPDYCENVNDVSNNLYIFKNFEDIQELTIEKFNQILDEILSSF